MSERMPSQVKAAQTPSFAPVRTGLLQRKCACGASPGLDGKCNECSSKRLTRQRHSIDQAKSSEAPPIVHEVLHSTGQPLDSATRAFMEPRFGQDFSQIRVHNDARAAESAEAVNALAYTVGRDVVFGAGQYAPGTTIGRRLLAHELTHTIQQNQAGATLSLPDSLEVGHARDAAEQEAEATASRVIAGVEVDTSRMQGQLGIARLQRQPKPTTPTPALPVSADAGVPAGVSAPPACVQPVNWRHFGPTDHGADAIRINITWESSTGRLADLANCTVREIVSYDPIPDPPFAGWSPPNPTILTVPGVDGAGMDTHSYPPGLRNISNPRQAGTATAHQVYQYRCTGPGCAGNWTDFPGETYVLTRKVIAQYVRPNPWRYRITKTGVGNAFNYSREVEIPVP